MVKERPLHEKNGHLLAEMTRHGYTMKSLAKTLDVHYLTIWRIVNKKHRPRTETAKRIAELLETTPAELRLETWGPDDEDES